MFSEVRFQFIWACKDSFCYFYFFDSRVSCPNQFLPLKYYTYRLIRVLWKIVFWWLFEEHYKWGKKNFLHGVRIQPRPQGFPAPAIF